MKKLFINANIILEDRIIHGSLLVKNDKIKTINSKAKKVDQIIDCKGKYLAPGFIDLHLHGGGGHDFMEASIEALKAAESVHLRNGTTAFCPTTVASSKENYIKVLEMVREAKRSRKTNIKILGVHLEGPYFSPAKRGAHEECYLRNPNFEEYNDLVTKYPEIKRWTCAAELPGATEFGDYCKAHGINASIGHSDASFEDCENAFEHGFTSMTHFYNAMSTTHKKGALRYAGCVEAGYIHDEVYTEVIADGHHVTPDLLRLIYKVKPLDKIVLVTDSLMAAGSPEGPCTVGALPAVVHDQVCYVADMSCLAGSVATTNLLVRTMYKKVGVPLYEAVRMASLNPATLMKLNKKIGSIQPGKQADLLIFDDDIQIESVFVNGKEIHF